MSKPNKPCENNHHAKSLRKKSLCKPWGLVVGLLSLALASVANAGPIHYYAELLTAGSGSGRPGDVRAQLDVAYDPTTYDILLDGSFWAGGNATVQVFAGAVSASLFQSDGEAVVSVTSTRGDVNVVASVFEVAYSAVGAQAGGGIAAVPEPGAMLRFGAGIGVVGIATRRHA